VNLHLFPILESQVNLVSDINESVAFPYLGLIFSPQIGQGNPDTIRATIKLLRKGFQRVDFNHNLTKLMLALRLMLDIIILIANINPITFQKSHAQVGRFHSLQSTLSCQGRLIPPTALLCRELKHV